MNFFCRLFGHTWVPDIDVPEPRWNTTKDGHTLVPTSENESIRHLEVCRRCNEEREVGARSHDGDRPQVEPDAAEASEPTT